MSVIVDLSGGGFLETALLETEVWMLDCLGFNLGLPLPQQFLRWSRLAQPTLVKSTAITPSLNMIESGEERCVLPFSVRDRAVSGRLQFGR